MAQKRKKTCFSVYLDDWGTQGGKVIYGHTTHRAWAEAWVSRNLHLRTSPPMQRLGYEEYNPPVLDDPEVFPEARRRRKGDIIES